ncbi:hypothetical protein F4825DRAFT_452199 [Nemania diffusa]|nr:hypothetical protein F4825DRAFT_452199 [Nemania diffusa]
MESPSSNDGAPLCRSYAGKPGSSDSSPVDLLANRPDPPNPPDLSGRGGSPPPAPASPITLQPIEGYRDSMAVPDNGEEKKSDNDDNARVVFENDDGVDTPPRLDKGKAPERAYAQFNPEQTTSTRSYSEADSTNAQQAQNPTELAKQDERLGTAVSLTETETEHDSEGSSPASESESQDASYPSSVFEEEDDYDPAAATSALRDQVTVSSWKQQQKQKADPEAETRSLSEASEEEEPFQPPSPGDPGWETSTGRPPRKLPILFQDALGRRFVFPWEKARTWIGMKELVEKCFNSLVLLKPLMVAGRYELKINVSFLTKPSNESISSKASTAPAVTQASSSTVEIPGEVTAGSSSSSQPSSSTNPAQPQQQQSQQPQDESSFTVLPDLWEEIIEPGMLVVQHMLTDQNSALAAQLAQPPTPAPVPHYIHNFIPNSHHHGWNHVSVGRGGRGGGRGRGRGGGTSSSMRGGRGGGSGNFVPMQPPLAPAVPISPPMATRGRGHTLLRGKTRKRQ